MNRIIKKIVIVILKGPLWIGLAPIGTISEWLMNEDYTIPEAYKKAHGVYWGKKNV